MAFTKIDISELNKVGALKLTDRPSETKSAHAIKAMFDAPSKEVIAPSVNNLIDELEDTAASASIGVVPPHGRRGNTVQALFNNISSSVSKALIVVQECESEMHTHPNKELLDTYTQTDADLTDAVAKKHAHPNKELLDSYTQSNSNIEDAIAKKHTHSNKAVLDKFEESGGEPTYDGEPLNGKVKSVNGKDGEVVLDATDVGALPDDTEIPDSLSDLTDDSTHRLVTDTEKATWNGKSTVSVTQVVSTGTKIATINVDGTDTDLYASGGGSVDNAYKTVKVGSTSITASGEDTLELVAGANVTLTPDASLKKVTIASSGGGSGTGDMSSVDYDSDLAVKTAGGIKAFVNAQISAQITSALTASY